MSNSFHRERLTCGDDSQFSLLLLACIPLLCVWSSLFFFFCPFCRPLCSLVRHTSPFLGGQRSTHPRTPTIHRSTAGQLSTEARINVSWRSRRAVVRKSQHAVDNNSGEGDATRASWHRLFIFLWKYGKPSGEGERSRWLCS